MAVNGGFQADNEELQRLSNTLSSSTGAIDDATQAPPSAADAGRSTAQVQDMISQFTKAAAGLRGGMEDAANNVADSGRTYEQTDHAGQDELSRPDTGGH